MISELTFAKSSLIETPISAGWKMRVTTASDWLSAIVPGCVHSDLLLNKQIPEPYFRTNEKQLQYRSVTKWNINFNQKSNFLN